MEITIILLAVLLPGVIWLVKKVVELWLAEKLSDRYGKKILLDAKIWKWTERDYEIGFALRNNLDAMLHLRGLTVIRPKLSRVAWFTHKSKSMPQISHLDSEGITNVHNAKLDIEPGVVKTVSMAIRVPSELVESFTVLAKYYVGGRTKPVTMKHHFSLAHAIVPSSVR